MCDTPRVHAAVRSNKEVAPARKVGLPSSFVRLFRERFSGVYGGFFLEELFSGAGRGLQFGRLESVRLRR